MGHGLFHQNGSDWQRCLLPVTTVTAFDPRTVLVMAAKAAIYEPSYLRFAQSRFAVDGAFD
jgi:hypothetical protein